MTEILFKLCIFGEGGVGKSSLVDRYLKGIFKISSQFTIGVDFHSHDLVIEGKKVALQIWDFGGEKRFRHILPTYIRGSSGGIIMYDITRYSSLKRLPDWLQIINEDPMINENPMPLLLVGGKLDLQAKRAISIEDIKELAEKYGLFDLIECSAKTGENVIEIFKKITRKMMEINGFL